MLAPASKFEATSTTCNAFCVGTRAGQFAVSFSPKDPAAQNGESWAQIGRWYAETTKGRREVSPAIRDKALEIVTGTTDPIEKIRRLSSFVQHSIRYVAIEIGIGGYQPHAAQEVFASSYGDCKDKATLLSAMLHEAGIDSYYVLINSQREYLAPGFPSMLAFNHVISRSIFPRKPHRRIDAAAESGEARTAATVRSHG